MTPEREAELEKLPTQLASEQQWQIYRMRDDSLVVDFFQGQYRSRLECMTCHKVLLFLGDSDTSLYSCICLDVDHLQHLHVSHASRAQPPGYVQGHPSTVP